MVFLLNQWLEKMDGARDGLELNVYSVDMLEVYLISLVVKTPRDTPFEDPD